MDSLARHVGEVAAEELRSHGQRLKSASQSSAHLTVNDLGEYWVDFSVAFKGDREGASRAAHSWAERVGTSGSIVQVGHMSLHGTDGTEEHVSGDDIGARAKSLVVRAWIEMDLLSQAKETVAHLLSHASR